MRDLPGPRITPDQGYSGFGADFCRKDLEREEGAHDPIFVCFGSATV